MLVPFFKGEPVTCRGNVFQEEDLPLGDVDARNGLFILTLNSASSEIYEHHPLSQAHKF